MASKKPQYIFRTSMNSRDGRVIYAKDYGHKAFKIPLAAGKK